MRFAIANRSLTVNAQTQNCGRTHVVWLVSGTDQLHSAHIRSMNFLQVEAYVVFFSSSIYIHSWSSLHNDGGQCNGCIECVLFVARLSVIIQLNECFDACFFLSPVHKFVLETIFFGCLFVFLHHSNGKTEVSEAKRARDNEKGGLTTKTRNFASITLLLLPFISFICRVPWF